MKQAKNWEKKFKKEFGIHFKNSSGELQFIIAFIEDLINHELQKFAKEIKKTLVEMKNTNENIWTGIEVKEQIRKDINNYLKKYEKQPTKNN